METALIWRIKISYRLLFSGFCVFVGVGVGGRVLQLDCLGWELVNE